MELICQAHAPVPDRFTPGEEASLAHSMERSIDRRGGMDAVEKKRVSAVFCP